MNTDIQESACKHFNFLESHYEFSRTEISRSHVRFENSLVFFDITADTRDGICVDFGVSMLPAFFRKINLKDCLSIHFWVLCKLIVAFSKEQQLKILRQ